MHVLANPKAKTVPNDPQFGKQTRRRPAQHCHKGNYRQMSVPSFSDPSNVFVGSLSLYPHAITSW